MSQEEALLRRILESARNLKIRAKAHISDEFTLQSIARTLPTHFLSISEIEGDLLELGLSTESIQIVSPLVSSLNSVYQRAVERFSFTPVVPGLPTPDEIIAKLTAYFRETYKKEVLPSLKERIFSLLHTRDEHRFVEVNEIEPSFNAVSRFPV